MRSDPIPAPLDRRGLERQPGLDRPDETDRRVDIIGFPARRRAPAECPNAQDDGEPGPAAA